MKLLISLREDLVDELDDIAEEVEASRSDVIRDILDYVLDHEEILNDIFPYEEEEEEESEEEE